MPPPSRIAIDNETGLPLIRMKQLLKGISSPKDSARGGGRREGVRGVRGVQTLINNRHHTNDHTEEESMCISERVE